MNNADLNYDSEWDIDQLLYQGTKPSITLPGSTVAPTNVLLFAYSLDYPPVVDATFQVSGDTVWRQMGDSTSTGLINLETFIASTPTGVYLTYYNLNVGDITVDVRYYVWTDKITY